MLDRAIDAPCDYVCLDEDGCSTRGWFAQELEAVRRSHPRRSTLVAIFRPKNTRSRDHVRRI
jgi:hypothetical protein